MKFYLRELLVSCKSQPELVPFAQFTYFFGQMGAGKTSIARLVDFCLGGGLDLTPAMQTELVSASLTVQIADKEVFLERHRGSNQVRVQWQHGEDIYDLVIPARTPAGEVIPHTSVEVLSDLLFHIAGIKPPRVRRSKLRDDSELSRLTMRDLLWYCYLDQDSIDSTFYHLDVEADSFKRLKSRDVLRMLLGFHQEKVAELESELEDVRSKRVRLQAGAEALRAALDKAEVASEMDIVARINKLEESLSGVTTQLVAIRRDAQGTVEHAVDALREQGRGLAADIEAAEESLRTLRTNINEEQRHLNELLTLSTKVRRTEAARAVLSAVDFANCPRCARTLPVRPTGMCSVCGQDDSESAATPDSLSSAEADIQARRDELQEVIERYRKQVTVTQKRVRDLQESKRQVDNELREASRQYDSDYLSNALRLEHRAAQLTEQIRQLEKLRVLPRQVDDHLKEASACTVDETDIRRRLRDARVAAERDAKNLVELQRLFLDCLVRARLPGFTTEDIVHIRSPYFLPEVTSPGEEDMVITSFANLSSGGKKTLFKCCFALAVHRLARSVDSILPSFLIIDSPMKNISERENREQFEGFHQLLYELAADELSQTQFIMIDKEFCPPSADSSLKPKVRHMTPDNDDDPPLIRKHRGR